MRDPWVCIDCGARQAEEGACRGCHHELTLDMHDAKVRELMYDIDLRLAQRRESRFRFVGVAVGMVVVFGLWLVPGYWLARGRIYPGLPLFIDQWLLMAGIGFGTSKLLEKLYARKRFPYLSENQEVAS